MDFTIDENEKNNLAKGRYIFFLYPCLCSCVEIFSFGELATSCRQRSDSPHTFPSPIVVNNHPYLIAIKSIAISHRKYAKSHFKQPPELLVSLHSKRRALILSRADLASKYLILVLWMYGIDKQEAIGHSILCNHQQEHNDEEDKPEVQCCITKDIQKLVVNEMSTVNIFVAVNQM